jgi:ketosteroid isomerase-like protein
MPMVKGHEEGRAFYEAFFKAVKPDTKVYFDEIGVSEKWSFAIGTHESVDTPVDGGEPIHSKGKYLEIHKRQPDGSLKFYRHMWSEDE